MRIVFFKDWADYSCFKNARKYFRVRKRVNKRVDKLSQVTENIDTLFVTLSGDNPTTIGTLYRPPNDNLEKALDKLSSILDIAKLLGMLICPVNFCPTIGQFLSFVRTMSGQLDNF